MKRTASLLVSTALLLGLSGCANLTVGTPIETSKIQEIREGYTTKDRVMTLFGQPRHNVPGQDGEIWVYRHLDGRGTVQELTISFTGHQVSTVTHHQ